MPVSITAVSLAFYFFPQNTSSQIVGGQNGRIEVEKSSTRETKNLLTSAVSRTDTILEKLHDFFLWIGYEIKKNTMNKKCGEIT